MTQPNFLRKDLTTSCIGFGLRGASKAQAHRALYRSSSTQKFINDPWNHVCFTDDM